MLLYTALIRPLIIEAISIALFSISTSGFIGRCLILLLPVSSHFPGVMQSAAVRKR